MDFLNPYKWLLWGGLALAVCVGVPIIVHRYNDGLREEGRAEEREAARIVAEAQTTSNRELGRLAELHLSAISTKQEKFFSTVSKEIAHAAAPLSACPIPEPVRVRLNAAAACVRGDSATPCGNDDPMPDAR